MKWFFRASITLNLLLAAAALWRFTQVPQGPAQPSVTPLNRVAPVSVTTQNSIAALSPRNADGFHWDQLRSDDLKRYRDNLRAIGCPETTVRDIIVAEINERFRARRAEIMAQLQPRFWDFALLGEAAIREQWGQPLAAISAERQGMIADVLGTAPALPGSSTPDIADKPAGNGGLEPESEEASWLRSRESLWAAGLAGFEPTEQEWRDITRLRVRFEEAQRQLGDSSLADSEKATQLAALQSALDQDIAAALGPERHGKYQLAGDSSFQEVHQIAQRFGLQDSAAREAHSILQAAQKAAALIRENDAMKEQERHSLLQSVEREAEQALKRTLGVRGFAALSEHSSSWNGILRSAKTD